MRKAIIDALGKVVNVVSLPDDWIGAPGEWAAPVGHTVIEAGNGGPGDTWDGVQFMKAAPVIPPPPTSITYEAFQERFTTAEFDAATGFIEEIDLTTGKPKRLALKQGMARVYAKGIIDLLDPRTEAFLTALVNGGVLASQRKTEILIP